MPLFRNQATVCLGDKLFNLLIIRKGKLQDNNIFLQLRRYIAQGWGQDADCIEGTTLRSSNDASQRIGYLASMWILISFSNSLVFILCLSIVLFESICQIFSPLAA